MPIAAQDAGRAGAARKGQPWLIDPAFAREQHERARRAAAKVINADPEDTRAGAQAGREQHRQKMPELHLPFPIDMNTVVII